jgi:hypothetical protein
LGGSRDILDVKHSYSCEVKVVLAVMQAAAICGKVWVFGGQLENQAIGAAEIAFQRKAEGAAVICLRQTSSKPHPIPVVFPVETVMTTVTRAEWETPRQCFRSASPTVEEVADLRRVGNRRSHCPSHRKKCGRKFWNWHDWMTGGGDAATKHKLAGSPGKVTPVPGKHSEFIPHNNIPHSGKQAGAPEAARATPPSASRGADSCIQRRSKATKWGKRLSKTPQPTGG